MDVDILENIIKISSNKKNTLLYFLKKDIQDKVKNYELLTSGNNNVYLLDTLICIRKDTLEIEYSRRISYIGENSIGLQKNNYSVYINPNEYYLFLKPARKKNNKKYFEELLKRL
jgi:hypothetical protein